MNKLLCGFLSPEGTYFECDSWEHLDMAWELVEKYYPESRLHCMNRIACEKFLNDTGWVEFLSRGVSFQFRVKENSSYRTQVLTDVQKDFIIEHLEHANNDDQKQEMLKLLEYNDAYQEDYLLQKYDNSHPERNVM